MDPRAPAPLCFHFGQYALAVRPSATSPGCLGLSCWIGENTFFQEIAVGDRVASQAIFSRPLDRLATVLGRNELIVSELRLSAKGDCFDHRVISRLSILPGFELFSRLKAKAKALLHKSWECRFRGLRVGRKEVLEIDLREGTHTRRFVLLCDLKLSARLGNRLFLSRNNVIGFDVLSTLL